MTGIGKVTKLIGLVLILPSIVLIANSGTAYAELDPQQKEIFDIEGARYFELVEGASSGCATILPGNDNPEKTWNFLIGKGLTAEQTAGIMGNLKHEGHFEPRLVEYGWLNSRGEESVAGQPSSLDDVIPPNRNSKGQPGYGIVQWTSPGRKDGLQALSDEKGIPPSDLGLQLEFLWKELNESYKSSTLDPIMATDDVEEVSDIFLEKFERPAHQDITRPIRRRSAQEFLTLYGSNTSGATASATNSGCVSGEGPSDVITIDQTVKVKGIDVHPSIATELERIIDLAEQEGLELSGWGWRSTERQEELRAEHGCGGDRVYDNTCKASPPTAVPGRSNHERGTAVDFTCSGSTIKARDNPCYIFLEENTSLINLESEPWHWSIDGN